MDALARRLRVAKECLDSKDVRVGSIRNDAIGDRDFVDAVERFLKIELAEDYSEVDKVKNVMAVRRNIKHLRASHGSIRELLQDKLEEANQRLVEVEMRNEQLARIVSDLQMKNDRLAAELKLLEMHSAQSKLSTTIREKVQQKSPLIACNDHGKTEMITRETQTINYNDLKRAKNTTLAHDAFPGTFNLQESSRFTPKRTDGLNLSSSYFASYPIASPLPGVMKRTSTQISNEFASEIARMKIMSPHILNQTRDNGDSVLSSPDFGATRRALSLKSRGTTGEFGIAQAYFRKDFTSPIVPNNGIVSDEPFYSNQIRKEQLTLSKQDFKCFEGLTLDLKSAGTVIKNPTAEEFSANENEIQDKKKNQESFLLVIPNSYFKEKGKFHRLFQSFQYQWDLALKLIRNENFHAPFVPDSSSAVCRNCDLEFDFFRRRHHCRCCGNLFCHECSCKSVPFSVCTSSERVCDSCYFVFHVFMA